MLHLQEQQKTHHDVIFGKSDFTFSNNFLQLKKRQLETEILC